MRADQWKAKFDLWFFRDMSDDQRTKLFQIFGLPVDEIRNHGTQRHCLKRVFAALEASLQSGSAGEVVAWQHRVLGDETGEWSDWRDGRIDTRIANAQEERALVVATPAKAAGGWRLVPMKPTREMAYAAAVSHYGKHRVDRAGGVGGISMTVDGIDYDFWTAFKRFWKGALPASPSPDGERQEGEGQ